jgi:hypothetical protein
MSIETHQCPYCELRFASKWELEAHVADSHSDRDPGDEPG